MFTRWHDAAHDAADPGLSWLEWSADRPEGGSVDLDDQENWERANPALGGRMSLDVVSGERATFPDQSFARERLGMWATEESERVLPLAQWEACSNPNLVDDGGEVALAIDVNPARDCASIAAAGATVDGTPFVDVIETRRGTPDWLLERVASICSRQPVRAVLIDGKGPAASLIDPLKRRKVKVSVTGAGNMAAAVAEFYDAVMAERVWHLDQPGLNLAASVARKRRLGDAWAWNRKDTDSDITPLVAVTLALFGHAYTGVERPRPRKSSGKVVVW
jgi:phage terminase large subunit-like protein